MPRKAKLTWQSGTDGRKGRWRKKYKGRVHHFPGGRGKTDFEAHDAAVSAWEKLKVRIDEAAPKPHEADYVRAIAEWERVLIWCRKHQEDEIADVATEKLEKLRKALSTSQPRPVASEDTFDSRFDRGVRYPGLDDALAEVGKIAEEYSTSNGSRFAHLPEYSEYLAARDRLTVKILGARADHVDHGVRTVVVPASDCFDRRDPLELERGVWRDRLDVMQRAVKAPDDTVNGHVAGYLAGKRADAEAGELTVGRVDKLRVQLSHFRDWLGGETPVAEINSQTLRDYRAKLLENVAARAWSRTTASERLSSIKSFVRWLWQYEAIATLPRAMAPKSKLLEIGKSYQKIVIFDPDEIRRLLTKASSRTRLYILLMLNCGMTQKDISDLRPVEVDDKIGQITRKRSKTREHANVPEVSYLLWPETLALLQQERSSPESERVLLNERGGPLWSEELSKDGKYKKNDNVRTAFDRLRRKLRLVKPLKSLKKTSASLLRASKEYKGLEDLFLGHAPQSMSDRHYAKPPQDLLGEAIGWLRQEYDLESMPVFEAVTSP